ncbi:hypothetical protein [Streptomyces sp. NPDC127033]|uniref:hypothetical protein n=1 Tax=Streptomyces sp. NPDC127033 TaxID=3347110 RepID=UPI0036664B35
MMDFGFSDRAGRRVVLRDVDDENWRAVADTAPLDDQRDYVPALAAREDCRVLRLSYHLDNSVARELYVSLGFRPTETVEGDEVVVEVSADTVRATPV